MLGNGTHWWFFFKRVNPSFNKLHYEKVSLEKDLEKKASSQKSSWSRVLRGEKYFTGKVREKTCSGREEYIQTPWSRRKKERPSIFTVGMWTAKHGYSSWRRSAESRPPRASKAKYSLRFYPERSGRCLEVLSPRMHDRICFWKQITLLKVQRPLQQRQKRTPIIKPQQLFIWRLMEVMLGWKEKWGRWVKSNVSSLHRSNQAKQKEWSFWETQR